MKIALGAAVSGLMACFLVCGQSQHTVWVCDTFNGSDCHLVDSSVMGGLRYEDYKVTNPAAVQFDPTQRVQELAALGTSTADTLCEDAAILQQLQLPRSPSIKRPWWAKFIGSRWALSTTLHLNLWTSSSLISRHPMDIPALILASG